MATQLDSSRWLKAGTLTYDKLLFATNPAIEGDSSTGGIRVQVKVGGGIIRDASGLSVVLTQGATGVQGVQGVQGQTGISANHNTLGGLQGGNGVNEYFHLTNAQYTAVTTSPLSSPDSTTINVGTAWRFNFDSTSFRLQWTDGTTWTNKGLWS